MKNPTRHGTGLPKALLFFIFAKKSPLYRPASLVVGRRTRREVKSDEPE